MLDLGPLPNRLGYVLRRAQVMAFKDFIETCAEVDVRPVIYSILTIIERNPGTRQGLVGAALGIKRSNVVSLVNELESRGLAVRSPHESDLRSHALHLTKKGEALLHHLNKLVQSHEERIGNALDQQERTQLIDLLSRLHRSPGSSA